MDQSNGKVIFHVIRLTKCLKPSGPDQPVVDRAYVEDELLCSVKCIYVYLDKGLKPNALLNVSLLIANRTNWHLNKELA